MRWFSVLVVTVAAVFVAAPLAAQEAAAEAADVVEAAVEEKAADHAEAEHAKEMKEMKAEHAQHAKEMKAEHAEHAKADFSAKYASYTAAFNAGDVDAVLAHYAEDAVAMFEGGPAVNGHAEMAPRFEELFAMGAQIELHPIAAHSQGHTAGDEGHYVLTMDVEGETVTRSGYWMGMLHKHDDGWKFVRLVSNSDQER